MKLNFSLMKQIFFALLAVGALTLLGLKVSASRPSNKFNQVNFPAPAFSFQDQEGKIISSRDLLGKVWVVDFIFSRCAGTCPLLTHQMSLLQKLWESNQDFRLVTFTVDPDYDTVPRLAAYAGEYQADAQRWFFLTGKKLDIYHVLIDGFKATAGSDPQGGQGFQFVHTTRMMLVDAKGTIRGFYDGEDTEDIQKLERDLRYLMSSRSHT